VDRRTEGSIRLSGRPVGRLRQRRQRHLQGMIPPQSLIGRIKYLRCGLVGVCQSLRCANTAERIAFLFGAKTLGNPRNSVSLAVSLSVFALYGICLLVVLIYDSTRNNTILL